MSAAARRRAGTRGPRGTPSPWTIRHDTPQARQKGRPHLMASQTRQEAPNRRPLRAHGTARRPLAAQPPAEEEGVLAIWIAQGPVVQVGQGCREVKRDQTAGLVD